MGRKKRRRTDNVIQFPKDHNIAEEMLKRVIDLFDMQVYLNKWAKSMLQYQSEDDPNIKQTYEEYIAELDVDGTPFVDGMTEVEMRREYRNHIEGFLVFLIYLYIIPNILLVGFKCDLDFRSLKCSLDILP